MSNLPKNILGFIYIILTTIIKNFKHITYE